MTQADALDIMFSGANVFLTGEPGSGKTYTLNKFIEEAESDGKVIAITASTGIAASHIGGTTIHSWSGLGIAEELTEDDIRRYKNNERIVDRYRDTDILVIDEISMLHGKRLDMVNELAKKLRKNPAPFGGMQVILVGDLFQLPPVSRGTDIVDFAHLSIAWQELALTVAYITEQHRQNGDDPLVQILNAMRNDAISTSHRALLGDREMKHIADDKITRLYSHNVDVDYINEKYLDAIQSKSKRYFMSDGGDQYKVTALKKGLLAPEVLVLKVGAQVMFVANNFDEGFVNGTRGEVTGFQKKTNLPIVKTLDGKTIVVETHKWIVKEFDKEVAHVRQIPLRLAWAITIHKSQGMSLDEAEVDLSRAFTPGMGYVAISRVRSFDGLYLKGINDMALVMHSDIYELDKYLREASETARLELTKSVK